MFSLLALIGCEEVTNSAEKSAVTYLPVLTVNGEEEIELACNATGYTDAGAEASEGGSPIEVVTTVTGQYFGGSIVDVPGGVWEYADNTVVNTPDLYTIDYSAVNKDGIPAAAFRHITWPVCNESLTTSLAGMYTSSIVRTLDPSGGAAGSYSNLGPILIKNIGGNKFQLSDALGGWYDLGRKFGYTGSAPGMTVTVNDMATNSFTYGAPVLDQTFGELVAVSGLTVDAGTGTVSWTATWAAGYKFKVTLKR